MVENQKIQEVEKWKCIDGYDGDYLISNLGRVKSLKRNKELILKPKLHKGYYMVSLCKNSKHKFFAVHRLVAIAFVENPENKETINHIDGVKTNNDASNLEWCTQEENNKHAFLTGLNKKYKIKCVETNEVFDSILEASKKLKLNNGHISASCNDGIGVKGYHFKYIQTEFCEVA